MKITLQDINTKELVTFDSLFDAAEYCCVSLQAMKALSRGIYKTTARRWRLYQKEFIDRRVTNKPLVENY